MKPQLGVQQQEVLKGLKEWFYGLDRGFESDSEDDDDMQSYITSLSDVLKDTKAAAKKLEETTLRSNRKLGDVFKSIKVAYEKTLRESSVNNAPERSRASSSSSNSHADVNAVKELLDAQQELKKVQSVLDLERSEIQKKLEKADDEIRSFIQNREEGKEIHRQQIRELRKQIRQLMEEKAALEFKCKKIDTIKRDPFASNLFQGGGGDLGSQQLAQEKAELEAKLEAAEEALKKLNQQLAEKEARLRFLEDHAADAEQEIEMRVKAAESRAKKDMVKSFEEQTNQFQTAKDNLDRMKRESAEAAKMHGDELKALRSEHDSSVSSLKTDYESQLEKLRSELLAKQADLDEKISELSKLRNKNADSLERSKAIEARKAGERQDTEQRLSSQLAKNEDLEGELKKIRLELDAERRQKSEGQEELVACRSRLDAMEAELKQKVSDMSEVNLELESRRGNASLLSNDGRKSNQEEISQLRSELEKARSQIAEMSESQQANIAAEGKRAESVLAEKAEQEQLRLQQEQEQRKSVLQLQQQLETHRAAAREIELAASQNQESSDTFKEKLHHLLDICAPPHVFENAGQSEKRQTLVQIVSSSTAKDSWKDSQRQLVEFHQNATAEELLNSRDAKSAAAAADAAATASAAAFAANEANLRKALGAAQESLKESEHTRQELVYSNAELKRHVAELENLLKKSKELMNKNMEKLGEKMGAEMVKETQDLHDSMSTQISTNANDSRTRSRSNDSSKERRANAMKNMKLISSSVNAMKKANGGKSARMAMLMKLKKGSTSPAKQTESSRVEVGQNEKQQEREQEEEQEQEEEVKENENEQEKNKLSSMVPSSSSGLADGNLKNEKSQSLDTTATAPAPTATTTISAASAAVPTNDKNKEGGAAHTRAGAQNGGGYASQDIEPWQEADSASDMNAPGSKSVESKFSGRNGASSEVTVESTTNNNSSPLAETGGEALHKNSDTPSNPDTAAAGDEAAATTPAAAPETPAKIAAKRKSTGGLSIAMKMNMRRKHQKADEKQTGSGGGNKADEAKAEEGGAGNDSKEQEEEDASHSFEDRLLYFGVKKQKVALSSALGANMKANSIATGMLRRVSKQHHDDSTVEAIAKSIDEKKETLQRRENELKAEKESEEEIKARLANATSDEKAALQKDLESARAQQGRIVKQLENEQHEREELEKSLEREKDAVAELETRLMATENADNEKMEQLKAELRASTEIDQEKIGKLRDEVGNLESNLKEARREADEAAKLVAFQQEQECELKRQLNCANEGNEGAVAELELKLRNLKVEQQQSQEKQRQLATELEEKAQAVAKHDALMTSLVGELEEKLAMEKESGQLESQSQKKAILDLEQQLKETEEEKTRQARLSQDESDMLVQKLAAEHEETLGEMERAAKEKGDLLKLKERDLADAKETIHILKVKVSEGQSEIQDIRNLMKKRSEGFVDEKNKAGTLMKERERESSELKDKIDALKRDLLQGSPRNGEGEAGGQEGEFQVAQSEEARGKLLELVKNSEKLLSEKEDDLRAQKDSIEELEGLVRQYEGAIEKLMAHVADKDSELALALNEGARLLQIEKERADEINGQLEVMKKSQIELETKKAKQKRIRAKDDDMRAGKKSRNVRKEEKHQTGMKADVENEEIATEKDDTKKNATEAKASAPESTSKVEQAGAASLSNFKGQLVRVKNDDKKILSAKESEVVVSRRGIKEEDRENDNDVQEDEDYESETQNETETEEDETEEEEEEEEEKEEDSPDPETFDISDLDIEYVEANLRSVCECTARIRIKLDELESFMEGRKERLDDPSLIESKATLESIYADMIDELGSFGVDPLAALRSEIEKTWLKNKMLMQWKSSFGGSNANNDNSKNDMVMYRVQYEMPAQIRVLKYAIKLGGGWRAALYLSTGDVNLDCDLASWPETDQIQMLKEIREHLEEQAQDNQNSMVSMENTIAFEREAKKKLEKEVKAARKAAKSKMLSDRRKKQDDVNALISVDDFNKERRLLVSRADGVCEESLISLLRKRNHDKDKDNSVTTQWCCLLVSAATPLFIFSCLLTIVAPCHTVKATLHQKNSQMALDILKLSLPDQKSRRKSVMQGRDSNFTTPRSHRNSRGSSVGSPVSGSPIAQKKSLLFQQPGSQLGTLPQGRPLTSQEETEGNNNNYHDEEQSVASLDDSWAEAERLISQSETDVSAAKAYSRKMSFQIPADLSGATPEKSTLSGINPREIKDSIESTESITVALEHDMAMMDKALQQLRKRRKAQAAQSLEEEGLKEKELEILVDRQLRMQKVQDDFRADYISEDVEDVISALKKRVGTLQDELVKARRRNDIISELKDEMRNDGPAGGLEVLESMIDEARPIMKLLDNLLVQKMTAEQSLTKIKSDLKYLKTRRGTDKEVRELTELKKKAVKDINGVELRIKAVRAEHDSNMDILKELYERLERVTAELFKDLSFKGLLGWGKMKEGEKMMGKDASSIGYFGISRGGHGPSTGGGLLKGSASLLTEFSSKVSSSSTSLQSLSANNDFLDMSLEKERKKINTAARKRTLSGNYNYNSDDSLGNISNSSNNNNNSEELSAAATTTGQWGNAPGSHHGNRFGSRADRPLTSPVSNMMSSYDRKFSKTSGSMVNVKKLQALKGWGSINDVEVVEVMERNVLRSKLAKFSSEDDDYSGVTRSANPLPSIGGGGGSSKAIDRPMTGIKGSQSRQGIAGDILNGVR